MSFTWQPPLAFYLERRGRAETSLCDIVNMDCSSHVKRSVAIWRIAPLKLIVRLIYLLFENSKANTLFQLRTSPFEVFLFQLPLPLNVHWGTVLPPVENTTAEEVIMVIIWNEYHILFSGSWLHCTEQLNQWYSLMDILVVLTYSGIFSTGTGDFNSSTPSTWDLAELNIEIAASS